MSKDLKIASTFLAAIPGFSKIFSFYKEDQNYRLLNNYLKENSIFKHGLILIFFQYVEVTHAEVWKRQSCHRN